MDEQKTWQDEEFDQVFAAVYKELKRLAAYLRRSQRAATMSTTDVVDETYLKMFRSSSVVSVDRLHFKRIAARAMRQILTDAARKRHADKRGGMLDAVTLGHADEVGTAPATTPQLMDLHRALDQLMTANARLAEIVEMRYFGGFSITEIKGYFGLSDATIERDIRAALAWLKLALNGGLRVKPKTAGGSKEVREP